MTTKSRSDATGALARALPQLAEIIVVTLVIAVLAVGLQLKSHCYSVDFSDADAVSHYPSGLAFHDYFLSGLGSAPVAFIKNFHSHYPALGLGHWGPVYYFVEALWMLIFSTSLAAVLALSVTITTATALGIYAFALQTAGRWPALLAGCVFVLTPLVQSGTCELLLDIPIAVRGTHRNADPLAHAAS